VRYGEGEEVSFSMETESGNNIVVKGIVKDGIVEVKGINLNEDNTKQ
jgi:hypothetical protein